MTSGKKKLIAFQGAPGAYSDLACRVVFPHDETLPCISFDDVFAAVQSKKADLALIPIENAIAGRVADVHHLLPEGKLHIIGEHYQPIVHHLLALPGAKLSDIKFAHSHVQGIAQCRKYLHKRGIRGVVKGDTAGAAAELAKVRDKNSAAIASELAGKIYGLKSLAKDVADEKGNTTRFLILSREAKVPAAGKGLCVTSLVFQVRSVPAALYKALGGFATNGINLTKLESYLFWGKNAAAQFYVEVEAHPQDIGMQHALDELQFFAKHIRILGTYPAHTFRTKTHQV